VARAWSASFSPGKGCRYCNAGYVLLVSLWRPSHVPQATQRILQVTMLFSRHRFDLEQLILASQHQLEITGGHL
jgi:hypothetical protein